MKKVLFFLGVLLSLGMFCACNSDDENNYNGNNHSIEEMIENNLFPENLKVLEDLPEWLVSYIMEWESEDHKEIGLKEIGFKYRGIYEFSWKGNLFYFHNREMRMIFLDYIFNADGTRIDLTSEEREDIENNSKDWKVIYKFSMI
ncbi:MAG: hypothetical protein J6W38_11235 [Prevotella sp.]|nr:hypothetical protein [Prevotella sp.]